MSDIHFEKTVYSRPESLKDNSYVLTIFDGESAPFEVDLKKFNKSNVTFGRDATDDIHLSSRYVSRKHGVIYLRGRQLVVEDRGSLNGLLLNGRKVKQGILTNGSILRIDNGNRTDTEGVLIFQSDSGSGNKWSHRQLTPGKDLLIGRSSSCDIVLEHIGVSRRHAVIHTGKTGTFIRDLRSTNGVFINGKRVSGDTQLHEKDIITITNTKLIFSKEQLYYFTNRSGIGIYASHIIKQVKNSGKQITICNDVSLNIEPGELVAIIGGSGAGKTTLMNAISGYSKPSSGQILINDEELYKSYESLKSIIGYVPQQDIVYDALSLWQMLDYAAQLRLPDDVTKAERDKRIQDVINMVELTGKENTLISQLSGGQKKRASIAVELLPDPSLFFLDEPASGLDPGTERNLMNTLKNMAQKGKTVILVTHSTLNLNVCDNIIFMGRGGNLCYYGDMDHALVFFNVTDSVEIYRKINDQPEHWVRKLKDERDKTGGIETPSGSGDGTISEKIKSRKKHNPIRQFLILSKRYLNLIINDRQRLIMLLVQGPLLALLISFVEDGNQFELNSITKSLLFALSCSAFWLGTMNSIQEVCKERIILRREYMTGLKVIPYVLSKYVVLGIVSLIQTGLMILVFGYKVGLPKEGVIMDPGLEMFITLFLTAMAAVSMGLFASCLFKNPDRAMTVSPYLLIIQILFSGLLFKLGDMAEKISYIAICRWSMEGLGTTANLNSLKNRTEINGTTQEVAAKAEDFFTFTAEHIREVWLILLAFVLVFAILDCIVLRKIKEN